VPERRRFVWLFEGLAHQDKWLDRSGEPALLEERSESLAPTGFVSVGQWALAFGLSKQLRTMQAITRKARQRDFWPCFSPDSEKEIDSSGRDHTTISPPLHRERVTLIWAEAEDIIRVCSRGEQSHRL
jgi:hypothetical protein